MLSIPEEAVRLWVAGRSEQEQGWVSQCEGENWLCLVQEVELLLVPLLFGWAHANFTLSEGGGGDEDRGWRLQRPGCGEHGFDAVGLSLHSVYGGGGCSAILRRDPAGLGRGGRGDAVVDVDGCFTARTAGAASPATATGRGGRPRCRATASPCCLTSIRAA